MTNRRVIAVRRAVMMSSVFLPLICTLAPVSAALAGTRTKVDYDTYGRVTKITPAKICVPTTCGAQRNDCGTLPDGCGGTLSCGTCSAGKTCGNAGYCCDSSTCRTTPPKGSLVPSAPEGGALSTWSYFTNRSGGTLDSKTGAYTAGATGSVIDVVLLTGFSGDATTYVIEVTAGVSIIPAMASAPPRGSLALQATGGSGTGFTWSFVSNASGGTLNAATGAYTAGATGSVTDIVQVVDSLGNVAARNIGVTPGVSIVPAAAEISPTAKFRFSVSGGSGTGYQWTLVVNSSGGSLDAVTGEYVAGATGGVTDTIQVVDSLSNSATAQVSIPKWKLGGSGCSSAGGNGPWAVLLLCSVLLLRRRRRACP